MFEGGSPAVTSSRRGYRPRTTNTSSLETTTSLNLRGLELRSAPLSASLGATSGKLTVKVEPRPTPALSARTVPPCSSTIWRTMDKPRPNPPKARVEVASSWRKRSKTCGKNSGTMPMPVSLIVTSTWLSTCANSTRTRPPLGVNLMAFEMRFHATCCKRSGRPRLDLLPHRVAIPARSLWPGPPVANRWPPRG